MKISVFKNFKIGFVGLLVSFLTLFFISVSFQPSLVGAQTAKEAVCQGIGAAADCSDPDGEPNLDNTIATVINILSIIVAVIAVIMIIIGGLKYITSNGDSGSTSSARNTVIYALVGLAIVMVAQTIVILVIGRASEDPSSGAGGGGGN